MNTQKHYTLLDKIILNIDQILRGITHNPQTTGRPYPAAGILETKLTEAERQHVAGLMRVNHAGEIAAQALYHGQGLVSQNPLIQEKMRTAQIEEGDHLAWCHLRLTELGSHTSYLTVLWYIGSFGIGMLAGAAGDRWSLGFLEETETQVVEHLSQHLKQLPSADIKSAKILTQMQIDEAEHRDAARLAGAASLPSFVKKLMRVTAKMMVKIAYRI